MSSYSLISNNPQATLIVYISDSNFDTVRWELLKNVRQMHIFCEYKEIIKGAV